MPQLAPCAMKSRHAPAPARVTSPARLRTQVVLPNPAAHEQYVAAYDSWGGQSEVLMGMGKEIADALLAANKKMGDRRLSQEEGLGEPLPVHALGAARRAGPRGSRNGT